MAVATAGRTSERPTTTAAGRLRARRKSAPRVRRIQDGVGPWPCRTCTRSPDGRGLARTTLPTVAGVAPIGAFGSVRSAPGSASTRWLGAILSGSGPSGLPLISVNTVAVWLGARPATAAALPRTALVGTPVLVSDGKDGDLPRRWWRTFWARQRGADERATDGVNPQWHGRNGCPLGPLRGDEGQGGSDLDLIPPTRPLPIGPLQSRTRGLGTRARRAGGGDELGLTPGRHLGGLVGVLRVASGTASQLDIVADQCDHGVIGDATLPRAVVVENVTQADLALLHESLSSNRLVRRSGHHSVDAWTPLVHGQTHSRHAAAVSCRQARETHARVAKARNTCSSRQGRRTSRCAAGRSQTARAAPSSPWGGCPAAAERSEDILLLLPRSVNND